jgi:hypothetical protein
LELAETYGLVGSFKCMAKADSLPLQLKQTLQEAGCEIEEVISNNSEATNVFVLTRILRVTLSIQVSSMGPRPVLMIITTERDYARALAIVRRSGLFGEIVLLHGEGACESLIHSSTIAIDWNKFLHGPPIPRHQHFTSPPPAAAQASANGAASSEASTPSEDHGKPPLAYNLSALSPQLNQRRISTSSTATTASNDSVHEVFGRDRSGSNESTLSQSTPTERRNLSVDISGMSTSNSAVTTPTNAVPESTPPLHPPTSSNGTLSANAVPFTAPSSTPTTPSVQRSISGGTSSTAPSTPTTTHSHMGGPNSPAFVPRGIYCAPVPMKLVPVPVSSLKPLNKGITATLHSAPTSPNFSLRTLSPSGAHVINMSQPRAQSIVSMDRLSPQARSSIVAFHRVMQYCEQEKLIPRESVIKKRLLDSKMTLEVEFDEFINAVAVSGVGVVEGEPPQRIIWPRQPDGTARHFACADFFQPTQRLSSDQTAELVVFLQQYKPEVDRGRFGFAQYLSKHGPKNIQLLPHGVLVELVQLLLNQKILLFKKGKVSVNPNPPSPAELQAAAAAAAAAQAEKAQANASAAAAHAAQSMSASSTPLSTAPSTPTMPGSWLKHAKEAAAAAALNNNGIANRTNSGGIMMRPRTGSMPNIHLVPVPSMGSRTAPSTPASSPPHSPSAPGKIGTIPSLSSFSPASGSRLTSQRKSLSGVGATSASKEESNKRFDSLGLTRGVAAANANATVTNTANAKDSSVSAPKSSDIPAAGTDTGGGTRDDKESEVSPYDDKEKDATTDTVVDKSNEKGTDDKRNDTTTAVTDSVIDDTTGSASTSDPKDTKSGSQNGSATIVDSEGIEKCA